MFFFHFQTCFNSGNWQGLISLFRHPAQKALERDNLKMEHYSLTPNLNLYDQWSLLLSELDSSELRLKNLMKFNKSNSMSFAFIEGVLVRAVQDGDWVLLDEINLAPPEMLDCLNGLLESELGSIVVTERG